MGKYILHNRLGSGGFAVQATLAAANIDFAYDPIDSVPDEPLGVRVRDLNAWGQVPVLELEDGTKITEVAAILMYLALAEPSLEHGPILWIENRALYYRWTVFLAVNVYEGILRQSYSHRYIDVPSDTVRAQGSDVPSDLDALLTAAVQRAATRRVHEALQCLEKDTKAHRYVLGDQLSPCDILLAMLYAWHNQKPDLPKCTWITTQVATHPKIRAIWEQNFHDRLDFKWHKL